MSLPSSLIRRTLLALGLALPLATAAQQLTVSAADTRRDFAANTLVLVIPTQDAPAVATVADLNQKAVRRIAIGKPASVPVGRYTKQALEAANAWTALEPKFVHADSVRQVLDYVARGEAEAGFVYRTDAALMAGKVRIVQTVEGHAPVTYPIALVSQSRQKALARDFIAYVSGAEGQAILAKFGFAKP